MAGVALLIRQEDAEVRAMLKYMGARARDLSPAMKIVGQIIRSSVVRNFEEGGRLEKWKRLIDMLEKRNSPS